jgi:Fic family protein
MGGLPSPKKADRIWNDIWFHEAHHSTAIEGNTLVLKQVEALLARGETVGNKELKEYLEVQGYANAATWVYEQARRGDSHRPLITLQEVRQIHFTAMTPVWGVAPHPDATPDESPGNFRQHEIHPFPSRMTPPTYALINAEMRGWLDDVNALPKRSGYLCERLAEVHSAFERIHPFIDGNGRAGRLILNLLLVRLGYPPAVIQKRERPAYLKALARSDRGEHAPLGEQIARAVLDSLMRFLLPAVASGAKLVRLEALAAHETSASALRQAAERGRLRAVRDDSGIWRSTRRWVDDYKRSRYAGLKKRRGPRRTSAQIAARAEGVAVSEAVAPSSRTPRRRSRRVSR